MAGTLTASMPQFTQLGYNTTVVLEAIDPTTGAAVAGVAVTNVEIWADVSDATAGGGGGGGVGGLTAGPFMLVPGPGA